MSDEKKLELVALDAFVSTVSHDLRTPLSTIHLSASLIIQDCPQGTAGDRIRSRVGVIQRQVSAMTRMVSTLLDAEKIAAGKLPIHKSEVDAAEDILEVLDEFMPLASFRNILMDAVIPIRPLPVVYDRDRIRQVLGNLISNAMKFSYEGTVLTLKACLGEDESMVRFEVSNSGEVIPESSRGRIFDRFEQGRSKSDHTISSGLGLWICRWIVQAHDGRIWVEPTSDGNRFCFVLPRLLDSSSDMT